MVTQIQDTIEYVYFHPQEKVAALALADRFQEEKGYGRVLALRKVARLRRAKKEAADIELASDACSSLSMVWDELCERIREAAGLQLTDGFQIWITGGRSWPRSVGARSLAEDGFWELWTVMVGAKWIIRNYYELLDNLILRLPE